MYTTCIFCHAALGANDVIEQFPVGRRIAFDADQGRLWVVCPKCERWNLSPFETRWEAIEEAERQYRNTRRRVATDNIALARLPEGLELVRIGRPLRPEFAAWRYGDQFGRRRRRLLGYGLGGAALAAVGVVAVGPAVAVGAGLGFLPSLVNLGNTLLHYSRPVARMHDRNGDVLGLTRNNLVHAELSVFSENAVALTFDHRRFARDGALSSRLGVAGKGRAELHGDEALRALASLLPALNRSGGSDRSVARAVHAVEAAGSIGTLLQHASNSDRRSPLSVAAWSSGSTHRHALITYTTPMRLALEMALHEDDERRAMAGELGALYARWEEAERVARIADGELTSLPNA